MDSPVTNSRRGVDLSLAPELSASGRLSIWALLLAIPYLILAGRLTQTGYLSEPSAYLLDKAYLLWQSGTPEKFSLPYPPLPFVLVMAWPDPRWVALLCAMAGGLLIALLVRDLRLTDLPRREWLPPVLALVAAPVMLMVGSTDLPGMLGLLLLYLAWRAYQSFVEKGLTLHVFQAGLALGAAYFTTPFAVIWALALAAMLPFSHDKRDWPAHLSAMVVLAFPIAAAMASWAYLSWLFAGSVKLFYPVPSSYGLDLLPLGLPLLAASLLLLERQGQRMRLLSFALPLGLGLITPGLDLSQGSMVVAACLVFALAGLPRRLGLAGRAILLGGVVLQIGVSAVMGFQFDGMAKWWGYIDGRSTQVDPDAQIELRVAQTLAHAPRHSILIDDAQAYRMVALTGTGRPYQPLRASPLFKILPAQSDSTFQRVLVSTDADATGPLAPYAHAVPPGMVLEARFGHYALYRWPDVTPLFFRNWP